MIVETYPLDSGSDAHPRDGNGASGLPGHGKPGTGGAAHHVPAEGHILLHAADHGAAGRMVAEYASTVGASTIVIGAPTHGRLPALMDGSASHELARHTRSNVLVVNPDAPAGVPAEDLWGELAKDG